MEFEAFGNKDEGVSNSALEMIDGEVQKAIVGIIDDDSETAIFLEKVEMDYKVSQLLVLEWLERNTSLEKILYAGSGFDVIPKFVFGEEKVIHTSLEEYKIGDRKYFPDLGSGNKVITDNEQLPFSNSIFDMVIFFGLPTEIIIDQLSESNRVLKDGGLIICERTIINDGDPTKMFFDYERVKVPSRFQNRGISETEFYVFKK